MNRSGMIDILRTVRVADAVCSVTRRGTLSLALSLLMVLSAWAVVAVPAAEAAPAAAAGRVIDVNISQQVLTLYEGDAPVASFPVATGLAGADTPIGWYRVQYKMPTAHFRGVNSATGTPYDLPNVRWVMAFMGDYTIHGAYWRQGFGARGSNGCVSLSDAHAAVVYNWAPVGTPIHIHY
jgi:lipoprotein-anchoring transpeptidase ErfK/SrfK